MKKKIILTFLMTVLAFTFLFPTNAAKAGYSTFWKNLAEFGNNCYVRLTVDKIKVHKTDDKVTAIAETGGTCRTMYYRMVLAFPKYDYQTYLGSFSSNFSKQFSLKGLYQDYRFVAKVFLFIYRSPNYSGMVNYFEMPVTIFPRGDYSPGLDKLTPIETVSQFH